MMTEHQQQASSATGEETATAETMWQKVKSNPFDFSSWETLVTLTEGSLAKVVAESPRNILTGSKIGPSGSARTLPEPIQKSLDDIHNVYSSFLSHFPYCFGYWKKYADCILAHMGEEPCRQVYERSVVAFPNSLDLWVQYCSVAMKSVKISGDVRDLFREGAKHLENDPNAYAFFDLYLQWEEQKALEENSYSRVLTLLESLIRLPLYHAQRYLERYQQIASVRPTSELIQYQEYMELRRKFSYVNPDTPLRKPEMMIDDAIDAPIKEHILQERTQSATTAGAILQSCYKFEEAIKRPYFHVMPLDEGQLSNWRRFLDHEERGDSMERVISIFERCLVPCAMYEEFWLRYIDFLIQKNMTDRVEAVFERAVFTFVPPARPALFLEYVKHKEFVAKDITGARILFQRYFEIIPNQVTVIIHFVNFEARNANADETSSSKENINLESYLDSSTLTSKEKCQLYIQLAKQSLSKNQSEEMAREWYETALEYFSEKEKSAIPTLLIFSFLQFEFSLLKSAKLEERCKSLLQKVFSNPFVKVYVKRQLFEKIRSFLWELGSISSAWIIEFEAETKNNLKRLLDEEFALTAVNAKRPISGVNTEVNNDGNASSGGSVGMGDLEEPESKRLHHQ